MAEVGAVAAGAGAAAVAVAVRDVETGQVDEERGGGGGGELKATVDGAAGESGKVCARFARGEECLLGAYCPDAHTVPAGPEQHGLVGTGQRDMEGQPARKRIRAAEYDVFAVGSTSGGGGGGGGRDEKRQRVTHQGPEGTSTGEQTEGPRQGAQAGRMAEESAPIAFAVALQQQKQRKERREERRKQQTSRLLGVLPPRPGYPLPEQPQRAVVPKPVVRPSAKAKQEGKPGYVVAEEGFRHPEDIETGMVLFKDDFPTLPTAAASIGRMPAIPLACTGQVKPMIRQRVLYKLLDHAAAVHGLGDQGYTSKTQQPKGAGVWGFVVDCIRAEHDVFVKSGGRARTYTHLAGEVLKQRR